MAKAGRISISLTAGTAEFIVEMEAANAKLRDFGAAAQYAGQSSASGFRQVSDGSKHAVSDMQATSAALRTLEGGFTNNLRAAERFIAGIKGVGPLVQALFPIAGGIALLGV